MAKTPPPKLQPAAVRSLQDTALRYFLEVVRTGSISEASTRLNVAGSAISRQIAQLESLLDVALFDRHARGMVPSAAGELLANHALRHAHDTERVVNDIAALQGMQRGRVTLATTEGFAIDFLPRLISEFLTEHPGVQFEMGVHGPAESTRRVLHGDADIGITMSRAPAKGLSVMLLQPSPVMAVMRPDHPLTQFRHVTLSQMLAYPLALSDPDTTVRQLFDIAASRQRLVVEPALVSNHISSLLAFLRHHPDALTITGEISVRYQSERAELAYRRIRDRGLDLRNIEVHTLTGRTLSAPAQAFLQHLTQRLGAQRTE